MKNLLLSTVVLGTLGALGAPASAALVACPVGFVADGSAKVFNNDHSAVSGCQYLTPAAPGNVGNIANINTAGFFGHADWAGNGQTQIDTNSQSSGSWAINDVDFAAYDYIIVFKSGAGTNLTAFLFNEEFASGNWSTPFTDPPFDLPGNSTQKDVSHYTIARRSNPTTQVPEPGVLGLLGLGIVGFGVALRRKAA